MHTKLILEKPCKEEYNFFRWLSNCVANDKYRPVLSSFYAKDSRLFQASDGFELGIAYLDHKLRLPNGDPFPDGIWYISTLNKKMITLEKIDGIYPDVAILIREKIEETKSSPHIALTPKFLNKLTGPFRYIDINIIASDQIFWIVMNPEEDTFPKGKYLGLLMPVHSNTNLDSIQKEFSDMREILKEMENEIS